MESARHGVLEILPELIIKTAIPKVQISVYALEFENVKPEYEKAVNADQWFIWKWIYYLNIFKNTESIIIAKLYVSDQRAV